MCLSVLAEMLHFELPDLREDPACTLFAERAGQVWWPQVLGLAISVVFCASPAHLGRTPRCPITSLEVLSCYLRSILLQTVVQETLLLQLVLPKTISLTGYSREYLLLSEEFPNAICAAKCRISAHCLLLVWPSHVALYSPWCQLCGWKRGRF